MNISKIIFFGLIFLTFNKMKAATPSKNFGPINNDNLTRGCDPMGCGHFGASRGGRSHNGVDFKTTENQPIAAPFDCKVTRHGYPYADDLSFKLMEIKGINGFENFKAKLMYVKDIKTVGTTVKKGETLCLSDDISKKHGGGMVNHVHFELYQNGKLIDPTPFFS